MYGPEGLSCEFFLSKTMFKDHLLWEIHETVLFRPKFVLAQSYIASHIIGGSQVIISLLIIAIKLSSIKDGEIVN